MGKKNRFNQHLIDVITHQLIKMYKRLGYVGNTSIHNLRKHHIYVLTTSIYHITHIDVLSTNVIRTLYFNATHIQRLLNLSFKAIDIS